MGVRMHAQFPFIKYRASPGRLPLAAHCHKIATFLSTVLGSTESVEAGCAHRDPKYVPQLA